MSQTLQAGHRPELEEFVRSRIEACGGITFAEYMGHCLYHPQFGYYMGPRDRIGKGGDFFTSTSVHALFGRLVARQLRQMWELLGKGPFTVAEQGAGEGHLALDILDAAREEDPEFYQALSYRLVEISPDNISRQKAQLQGHGDKVSWSALEDLGRLTGCFLSNELVDAFPVHLVEMHQGQLREVYVVSKDGVLAEELREPSTAALGESFSRLGIELAEGNRAEVNLEGARWMEQVGAQLERGFVITIDYGYRAEELYAPQRRGGTLMCYHRHTSSENPYERIGCQDITAHVDFTSLEMAGQRQGLEPLCFREQYRFLMGLGFVEELAALSARETDENRARALRMTLKNLIMPDGGMGETFKVLIQGKAVGQPELLCMRGLDQIAVPSLF